ncbi:MAG: family 20 glycosylhydrolase, partial [Bacteroidota bacterium]
VGLEIAQGMKYDRHPELAGPAAYTKDEVRRIVRFLRDNGVEVFPIIATLGHANWLVIPHPELREDGDEHTLCTRNPQARKILVDCFEEALEVFEPRYFHFGLDEIRWVTATAAPDSRCALCKGIDKRELFLEHVRWLQAWATTTRVQMMMWADMLIPEHNGGAPFNLADTVDKLPKDIVMCDWSTSLAPLSLWDLQRRGFPVLKSNSCGVNPAQTDFVIGNMWGIWAKTPWLTESCWRIVSYAYPRQIAAAEYSWNPYPDLLADDVPCLPEYFQKRPLAQKRLAQRPEPAGGKTVVSLGASAQTLTLAGMKLQPFAEPVTAETTMDANRPAAAVYLLVGADLAEADRTAFLDAFKQGTHWQGVPIGEFEITLADGTKTVQPILYGTHVRSVSREEPFPQVLEALGQEWSGTRMGYLLQWVNPHPDTAVASIRFSPGMQAAKPVWLGAAVRSVREPNRPAE